MVSTTLLDARAADIARDNGTAVQKYLGTCCPACRTTFKVAEYQMNMASGWVRCGRCSCVFNAELHASGWIPPTPTVHAAGLAAVENLLDHELECANVTPDSEAGSALVAQAADGLVIEGGHFEQRGHSDGRLAPLDSAEMQRSIPETPGQFATGETAALPPQMVEGSPGHAEHCETSAGVVGAESGVAPHPLGQVTHLIAPLLDHTGPASSPFQPARVSDPVVPGDGAEEVPHAFKHANEWVSANAAEQIAAGIATNFGAPDVATYDSGLDGPLQTTGTPGVQPDYAGAEQRLEQQGSLHPQGAADNRNSTGDTGKVMEGSEWPAPLEFRTQSVSQQEAPRPPDEWVAPVGSPAHSEEVFWQPRCEPSTDEPRQFDGQFSLPKLEPSLGRDVDVGAKSAATPIDGAISDQLPQVEAVTPTSEELASSIDLEMLQPDAQDGHSVASGPSLAQPLATPAPGHASLQRQPAQPGILGALQLPPPPFGYRDGGARPSEDVDRGNEASSPPHAPLVIVSAPVPASYAPLKDTEFTTHKRKPVALSAGRAVRIEPLFDLPDAVDPRTLEEPLQATLAANPGEAVAPVRLHRLERKTRSPQGKRLRKSLLVVMLIGSVAALAAQEAHIRRNSLAANYPALRTVIADWCQVAGCKIDPLRLIDEVVIDGSAFAKEDIGEGYRLTFALRNRAALPMDTPSLELSLLDAMERPVVKRILSPADFEGPAVLGVGAEFAGEKAITLAMPESQGSQPRVVGYKLAAFYPEKP